MLRPHAHDPRHPGRRRWGTTTRPTSSFRRASEVLESFAPIPYARNLYEHGRALLELGDPADGEDARRLLTRAATSFERYGLDVRVAQCEELLARID